MLAGNTLAAVLKFSFLALDPGSRTHAGQGESKKCNHDKGHDNNGDDGACSHRNLPSSVGVALIPSLMPTPKTFDLQAPSTHSNGTLPAREVVQRAAAAGVELFALTDHDS